MNRRSVSGVVLAITLGSALSQVEAQTQTPGTPSDAFVTVPFDASLHRRFRNNFFDVSAVAANPKTHLFLFELPAVLLGPTTSIAFRRRDSAAASPATFPAFDITVDVWMAHSPVHASELALQIAAHRGPDYRQVVAQRVVHFPPVPWRADNEYPFTHRISLDTPFQFTPGATGLIEMRISTSTMGFNTAPPGASFDHQWSADLPQGGYGNGYLDLIGTPCSPPGGGNTLLVSAYVGVGNHSMVFMWPQLTVQYPDIHFFFGGFSDRQWNGLSLPYDLWTLGAPGCFLLSSLEWQFPILQDGGGGVASADLTVPNDPRIAGTVFFVQGVHLDRSGNALGLFTSNAMRVRILPHIRTQIAYADWTDAGSVYGQGLVENFYLGGPVIQLDSR